MKKITRTLIIIAVFISSANVSKAQLSEDWQEYINQATEENYDQIDEWRMLMPSTQ